MINKEKLLKKSKQYKLASKLSIIPFIILLIFIIKGQFIDNKDMSFSLIVCFFISLHIIIMDYIGDHLKYLAEKD